MNSLQLLNKSLNTHRIALLFHVCVFFSFFANANEKADSIGQKIEFKSNFILDQVNNLDGGKKEGSAFLALFDFEMLYFPVKDKKSTRITAHIQKAIGVSPSELLIGDMQVASNIEGRSEKLFYQLLIDQKISFLRLKAGFHDLNTDFYTSDYASDFINSSFGISPSISINMPVSIYPSTTFGLVMCFSRETLSFHSGFYNLNNDFLEDGFSFENHFFTKGYLAINELAYSYKLNSLGLGTLKLGAYVKHQYNDPAFDQGSSACYGYYFLADQQLHQFYNKKELACFVQFGSHTDRLSCVSDYFGAGISYRNLQGKSLVKQIGLAMARASLNGIEQQLDKKRESVLEVSALIQLSDFIHFRPDFQYIINPSGTYANSTVGILRLILSI